RRAARTAILARGIWTAARAVGALPIPAALAPGRGLGRGANVLLGTQRRLALAHVGIAFPELSATARAQLVRATFEHAGQAFAELGLWRKLAREQDYVRFDNLHVLDDALAEGRGAFAITGHVGNWELLAASVSSRSYNPSGVARRGGDARRRAPHTRLPAERRADGLA